MICSDCLQPIAFGEQTAHAPNGVIHLTCAKYGKGEGHEVDVISLWKKIGDLQKCLQQVEAKLEHHERNIDFRIG